MPKTKDTKLAVDAIVEIDPQPNGHRDVSDMDIQPGGQLIDGFPSFVFRDGTIVRLRRLKPLVLSMIQSTTKGKPKPPMVREKMGKGGRVMGRAQPNYDDPEYQNKLRQWENEKNDRLLKYCIVAGIEDVPPEDYEVEAFLGNDVSYEEIKYFWIAEKLEDDEEIISLTEAITSLVLPTQEGIDDAEDNFSDSGKRETD